MRRKAYEKMIEWKNDPFKKALLVEGCRQIGKTYLILEFAKDNYDEFVYFNLERDASARSAFETEDLTADKILDKLKFENKKLPSSKNSAIILDEIQACLPAYSALKALCEHGKYDIIASGSLLGVGISDLQQQSPLGYVNILRMNPMDFEEYLWAKGYDTKHLNYVQECIRGRKPIDPTICKILNQQFRRFMVVGGMPAAVLKYIETGDYSKVYEVQKDILEILGRDAERYSKGSHRLMIESCFRSIPNQLAKANKKFEYIEIEKTKGGAHRYGPSLLWLKRAGLIHYCYNLSEPASPLMGRIRERSFKIYMCDTGLLTAMMGRGVAGNIVNRDPHSNNGSIMENAIACSLICNGYVPFFYEKQNSTLEVDFVINIGGDVVVMEVKSGQDKRSKSLTTLMKNHTVKRAMKICDGNVFIDDNGVEHYPLFGPCFFEEPSTSDEFEPLDDEILKSRFVEILGNE